MPPTRPHAGACIARLLGILACLLSLPAPASAQTTFTVGSEAALRTALNTLGAGDSVVLTANITLTGDLPSISTTGVTVNGNGFTLSGNNQFRGLVIGFIGGGAADPISVTVTNLTIRDTLARGGDGGDGDMGGGGGAGLGGALLVLNAASVTVSNVNIQSSRALGGDGGASIGGAIAGGGGGGLGGDGGNGGLAGGGGGGTGRSAAGGGPDVAGQPGVLVGAAPGGAAFGVQGGVSGGGGAGGDTSRNAAAGGGGDAGVVPASLVGGAGGFGGGGGGAGTASAPARGGGQGGYGGGGGGGAAGGIGGFGGGAGAGGTGVVNSGGFGGGDANQSTGGGGGAGLGGGVFVQAGGQLVMAGPFTVNGSSVAGGVGGNAAQPGSGFGAGMFLDGSGQLIFQPAAGQTITINDAIADIAGTTNNPAGARWGLVQDGPGRTVLRGANTIGGTTYIYDGALNVTSDSQLGRFGSLVNNGGTLEIAASGVYARDAEITGPATFSVAPGATATWTGNVRDWDGGGELIVTGGGTLALTNGANDYSSGTTVIGNSTLSVTSNGALGFSGSSVRLGDATTSGTLQMESSMTSYRQVDLGVGGGVMAVAGGATATWGGLISGAGGLTKAGNGTLELASVNTYAGATTVAAGTLRLVASSSFVPGPTFLLPPGASALSGVPGTSGVMTVNGGATLDLNGYDATFGTLNGNGNISLGNGTLTTGDAGSATVGGVISGSGRFVKNGTGTITLSGANTYTGGTTVSGGTLVGTTSSLQGSILNNANVTFDQAGNGTYAGAMSGTGSLTKGGSGVITLTGANTYSGGTFVNGGVLVGNTTSLRGAIAVGGGQVRFDQTVDGTLAGSLAGTGGLTKTGGGRLTLSGANALSGLLDIQQGAVSVNGSLAGSAAVRSGAGLSVNGSIGGVTVDAGGTFSSLGTVGGLNLSGAWTIPVGPAAPVGVTGGVTALAPTTALQATDATPVTINGNLTANPGAVVNIEATPGPKAPVQVNGTAAFSGTLFNVSVNDTARQRLASYALVSANQVTLANSTAASPLPNLVPTLFADTNTLRVSVLNLDIPLAAVGATPNGRNVGEVLDTLKPGSGELGIVIRTLAGLPDGELADAFEQIAGQVNVTDVKMAIIDSEAITDVIRSEISTSEDDDDSRYVSRAQRPRWWSEIVGQHARYGNRDGLSGARVNAGGLAGGFDVKRTDRFTFGIGGSLTQGGLSLRGLSEVSDMIAPRGFGYAGVRLGPFRLHGGGSAARTNGTSERQIQISAARADGQPSGSAFDRTAQSEQDGATYDAWSEWQDTFTVKTWKAEGKVGWRHARFARQAFTETGAGPLSLVGGEDTLTSTEADVLARVWRREGSYRPHFLFSFRRQLGDDENSMKVGFVDNPNVRFDVNGLPLARNTVLGRSGLTVRTGSGLEYTLQYEFRFAESEQRHTADFRIRFR